MRSHSIRVIRWGTSVRSLLDQSQTELLRSPVRRPRSDFSVASATEHSLVPTISTRTCRRMTPTRFALNPFHARIRPAKRKRARSRASMTSKGTSPQRTRPNLSLSSRDKTKTARWLIPTSSAWASELLVANSAANVEGHSYAAMLSEGTTVKR